jgi:hypothetical protein
VAWEISLHHEVEAWYLSLCKSEPETADLIEDAIDQLAAEGPALGRPLADRVKGSRYHNMKELRPPSSGTAEIRMLFAFDPQARGDLPRGRRQGGKLGWLVPPGHPAGGPAVHRPPEGTGSERSDERQLLRLERREGQGPRG